MNGTLYVGWGATNGLILPVIFSGSTASFGTGLPVPSGFSMKDLANCHEQTVSTSLTDINEKQPLIFFDPSTGNLNIENYSQFDLVGIFDVSGRIILSNTCEKGSNFYNLEEINPGIYLVTMFQSDTNTIYTKKVLKQ